MKWLADSLNMPWLMLGDLFELLSQREMEVLRSLL